MTTTGSVVKPYDALDRKRRVYKRDFNRIIEEYNKYIKLTPSIEYLECLEQLCKSIGETKRNLDSTYMEYFSLIDSQNTDDIKLEEELLKERDHYFSQYDHIISNCAATRRKFEGQLRRQSLNSSTLSGSSIESSIKLPKIGVPKFSGDIREFSDFKAYFETLVHTDDNILPVRKFHYLKDSLIGAAAATVANLPISERGYLEAWGRLLRKYDNHRLKTHTYFDDLYKTEKIKSDAALHILLEKVDLALRGLTICGEKPENWSSPLAYFLYTRLDSKTREDYDNTITDNSRYITWKSLISFCENRATSITNRTNTDLSVLSSSKPISPKSTTKKAFLTEKGACIACNLKHLLIDCKAFQYKNPFERLQLLRNNRMCVNCFSKAHTTSNCPSTKTCKTCNQKHHTLLHLPKSTDAPTIPSAPVVAATPTPTTVQPKHTSAVAAFSPRKVILLPSAVVRFECGNVTGTARVLLDDCSQPTLIADTFVRKLCLPIHENLDCQPIQGVGSDGIITKKACSLKLQSRYNNFSIAIVAEVIPTNALRYSLSSLSWDSCTSQLATLSGLQLADPVFYANSPSIDKVDILLGAEYSELCKLNESFVLDKLTVRHTQFGWTLVGQFPSPTSPINRSSFLTTSNCNIDKMLSRFWETEEALPLTNPQSDAEECERHFVSTTTRAQNGQFIVRLPFKDNQKTLVPNRIAISRMFQRSEIRRPIELLTHYNEFMDEYEKLGHMTKVPNANLGYFIPHHAVLRPTSTTTKLRVVFNASFKTSSGQSLNDILRIGPIIQPELFDALIRFRQNKYALTADIAKMYRCVLIHPDDRIYQKILWRTSPTDELNEYELNTVTYGMAPASFLATRCLLAIASSLSPDQSPAAEAIRSHFYMDDLLTGANSEEELLTLQTDIHNALKAAGFNLRKYQSNNVELLKTLPSSLVAIDPSRLFGDDQSTLLLGLIWEPTSDMFRLRITNSEIATVNNLSKRSVLSESAKVFDPLGLAAPFTIRAKLLLQHLWKEKLEWDDTVPDSIAEVVRKYFTELPLLSNFAVPRVYSTNTVNDSSKIIGFCDASDKAYCAVLYLYQNIDSIISCNIICAKTRVAPIKSTTIPKLELQGAILLAQLADRVRKILKINHKNVMLYSDSEVVLAWLAKPDKKWEIFVKNRIQKITMLFPILSWNYVSTEHNPADLATRGISASSLINSALWKDGPSFLHRTCFFIPGHIRRADHVDMPLPPDDEQQPCFAVVTQPRCSIIDRFSKYTRLLAVFGRVILFIRKHKWTRSAKDKSLLPSFPMNFVDSRTAVICFLQAESFSNELEALQNGKAVPKRSPLRNLDPFIDRESGLLRVSGRLQNAKMSNAAKHPIILPRGSHFTRLYVEHLHTTYCHAGKSFIIPFIQAEFWVCGGLNKVIKGVLHSCIRCARLRAETFQQVMGQLPTARVVPSRPFTNTGIDFCGPFNCRCLGHRSSKINKIYACIFVCLATRAVHIEIVPSLTSVDFLKALHRFVARRGLPAAIYSDNGTNFVGANNHLRLNDESIQFYASTNRIKWIFNPSRSPHRGGIWEAAVKSAKVHLVRVVEGQTLNYDEFTTLFTRIEAILNSRPLCYRNIKSNNVEDFVLTPSHFLINSLPYVIPEPDNMSLPLSSRYLLIQNITASFWKKWRSDFLNTLQRKEKWTTNHPNVSIGQIVLIKNSDATFKWPLAIVEEVFPDKSNVVRTVRLRTSHGTFVRDIRYLIPLPISPVVA